MIDEPAALTFTYRPGFSTLRMTSRVEGDRLILGSVRTDYDRAGNVIGENRIETTEVFLS